MARPLRITYPGAFYHITTRGNEQKDVFKSKRDREKFLEYFESATKRYGAVIHAYCLMSNHYHLLLETPEGNLSQIMRHLNGAYTTYFNVKRKRTGTCFREGTRQYWSRQTNMPLSYPGTFTRTRCGREWQQA